jgi:type I restriction enzyme S subunit
VLRFRWETEFKETEIGEIPREWEVKSLGEILAKIIKGKNPKKCLGDLPYLTAKYLRGEEEAEEFYNETAGVLVDENEIVIIWDGSNSGEVFKSKKGILASTMCKLLFDEEVANKTYAFYVLKTNEEDIKGAKSGTDDRHVDKEYFLNLLIPLPPLPEQSRIATVLSWFDDLIEIKKRQNEILEKTAMAIFKSWFIDFEPFRDGEFVYSEELGKEIPKGWEVKKWGDVVNFLDNQRIPLSEVERLKRKGQYPYYGANGIIDYIDDYIFDGRYLLVAEDGTVMDKNGFAIINIVEGKFWANNHVHVIQGKDVPIDYLYLHLKHYPIEPFTTGAVQPKLSQENFSKMPILLPPSPILQSFHSLVEPLFQKIILNQKQIMTLRKIRDTLLPLLVFGKLRVEEA